MESMSVTEEAKGIFEGTESILVRPRLPQSVQFILSAFKLFSCEPKASHSVFCQPDLTTNRNIYLAVNELILSFLFAFQSCHTLLPPLSVETYQNHYLFILKKKLLLYLTVCFGPTWITPSLSGNSCVVGFLLRAEFDLLPHLRVLFSALWSLAKLLLIISAASFNKQL